MASQDMVRTRKLLEEDANAKWGFIVYRCTYESDDEWARFMQYLNTSVRTRLERDGDGDLFDRIDWQVQDDREQFDRAGSITLRQHFTSTILPTLSYPSTARHQAFVAVYQLTLNRILTIAPPPEEFDTDGRGFLSLISHDEREGWFSIGVSYLVPRAYTLLDECGWYNIFEDGVACP
ncbi:hypothetical protein P171DRAFT_430119 [Karstenula rhodostoma CBS 690.94]|uniref:Uncharacterized protein n=1 Tax=Karstenula rhodostoma CBS 690.94 TaxID=1392251 RepID=A0A9P4PQL4_9PLEO|nr:hypothetical protein P171DRAFT_430119 [Karstenula rhodostoma CBS 690.94]